MTSRRLAAIFGLALAVLLVAFTPLSLALSLMSAEARGLSAQTVSGTIWRGRLQGAALAGAPLGDVRTGLDLLGVVLGGGRLRFETDGPLAARGVAQIGPSRFGLAGVEARLPSSLLAPALPLQGRLGLQNVAVRFRHGDCRHASGEASLADVQVARLGVPLPNLRLAGTLRCKGRDLILPLRGEAAGVAIGALVRIDGDGRYRVETTLNSSDLALLSLSGRAGFERTLDGARRIDGGQLGQASN